VLARVQELAVTRRGVELKQRLQRVAPTDDGYAALFGELIALEQTVRALRERGIGAL
jgi:hypothetical protein